MGVETAIIGSALISGYMGQQAAGEASKATAKASKASIVEQRRQFDIMQSERAPYLATGKKYLGKLDQFMSGDYDITQTPGYQFRLEEGMKAVQRSQAGRTLGGRAVKESIRYGQEYATGERGAEFSRLSTLAGYGPASFGTGGAPGVPGTMERAGVAQAQYGYQGMVSANQAIQGGMSNYMTWQAYNKPGGYGVEGDAYMPAYGY